ncbi:sugar ABC transporter permease [Candidatus Hecatella orcuttiae]|jgi:ABC-type sugar transport system permease subunit|uniref:carbohydrate ABC transporter permease n=1 Tax=Candidatus Hecatella orcuttiae TaxID=1935119 RepID=UPI0028681543|nr:sugar ABC transporter permease [Candidatus Hecatella orcuttiae]
MRKPQRSKPRVTSDQTFAIYLLLPLIFFTMALVIYPLSYSLWLSFQEQIWIGGLRYVFGGLTQYAKALKDPLFINSIPITFRFVGESVTLAVLIGLGIALALNQPLQGRKVIRALILLPWAISEFATGIIWSFVYKRDVGLLNAMLKALGIIESDIVWITPKFAIETVSIAFAWHMAPLAAFFFLAGLQFIPTDLYRQARIDGAGVVRRFLSVTLPHLKYSMLVITILITVMTARSLDTILTLTGGGPGFASSTFTNIVYVRTFKELQFAYGAALSWYVILIVVILVIVMFMLMTKGFARGGRR